MRWSISMHQSEMYRSLMIFSIGLTTIINSNEPSTSKTQSDRCIISSSLIWLILRLFFRCIIPNSLILNHWKEFISNEHHISLHKSSSIDHHWNYSEQIFGCLHIAVFVLIICVIRCHYECNVHLICLIFMPSRCCHEHVHYSFTLTQSILEYTIYSMTSFHWCIKKRNLIVVHFHSSMSEVNRQ